MLREIVLDTETTGLDPRRGDRLIEIGCVELVNRIPTGREFHCFVNPERDVPAEAEAVHGITTAFLKDKALFAELADSFLAFVGGDPLIIHNAAFDIGFINAELDRAGRASLAMDRVVDTLQLARRKHPAGPNTLDALCKRYAVDNSKRVKHGALMDATLLSDVYIELLGVRQAALGFDAAEEVSIAAVVAGRRETPPRPAPLAPRLTETDAERHRTFVVSLGAHALWHRYLATVTSGG